ncbi:MAG: T9SS type A sorting domain-containing protein [Bacteroidetes bacterium]|nr:T9SS type A sorting domain-containing protein [Bacteroidota bacterium]
MKKTLLFFCITMLYVSIRAQNVWQVSTLAGDGTTGNVNGAGKLASFWEPHGICIDASGNLYITDSGNRLIRKITPAGVVTTLAGSGIVGQMNGIGTAASFNFPLGMCTDAAGNIYIADDANNKIRKITPAGVVTTFAGSGVTGQADGVGTAASFNRPSGICIDAAGNFYVADEVNNKIRKITAAGVVTTLAGSGILGQTDGIGTAASFSYPGMGICADGAGNIYVTDQNKIRKITAAGVVTTLAGSGISGQTDGIGTAASFFAPRGICIDASGNLYVADSFNRRIRKITPAGVVSTIAGSDDGYIDAIGTAAKFQWPLGICIDATGNLYVADGGNNSIRKIQSVPQTPPVPNYNLPASMCLGTTANYQPAVTGSEVGFTLLVDSSISVPAPKAICRNKNGVFVLSAADSVMFYDFNGNWQFTYNSMGYQNVTAIAADDQNRLYMAVPDFQNPAMKTVVRFNAQGLDNGMFNLAPYQINSISTMAIGPGGLYVADTLGPYIDFIDTTSTANPKTVTNLPQPSNNQYSFFKPTSMVFGSNGQLYLADAGNKAILARNASDNNYYPVDSLRGPNNYFSIDLDTMINNNPATNSFYITSDKSTSVSWIDRSSIPTGNGTVITHHTDTVPLLHLRNPMGMVYVSRGGTVPVIWVANSGGNNVVRVTMTFYNITPALPTGLHFDFLHGKITGTATSTVAYTTHTITTQNSTGIHTTTVGFSIVPPGPVSNTVGATSSDVVNQADGLTVNYSNTSDCFQMLTIQDSPGGTVLGNTIATQTVYPTIATFNADKFVGRVTEVRTQSPDSALANVQLNFTYQDIQKYNASVAPTFTLTNDTSVNKTMKVGVLQLHTTKIGSKQPINHSPLTANWSTIHHQWEVKFPVTKFSTFYMADTSHVTNYSCANQSADTIVTTNTAYYWHNDSLFVDGDYADTLVNVFGCDSVCKLSITFAPLTTGINTPLLSANTTVYPNPSTGVLNIIIDNPNIEINNMRIINIMGQEVYSSNNNNRNQQLDLSRLPKGYYTLTITSKHECVSKKILLE